MPTMEMMPENIPSEDSEPYTLNGCFSQETLVSLSVGASNVIGISVMIVGNLADWS